MKFGINHYWSPTPKSVRKVADSLSAGALAVSSYAFMTDYKVVGYVVLAVSSYAFMTDYKVVAYIVLACAFVGKFLSNLFAEEPKS